MTDSNDTAPKPQPKPRRWPGVLLAISLALNLLVVGVVAGAVWRSGHRTGHERADRLMPLIMALPGEARRALRAEFAQQLAATREAHGAPGPERLQRLLVILRARPFDPAALKAHFQERAVVHERQLRIGREVLIARISGLSDRERAAYADRVEHRARRRRRD